MRPALIVEVLLSAFLIGAVLTTIAPLVYFTDPVFLRYLLNVTGHISYLLPGVFAENPHPNTVNLQLWTVPYELYCYIALGALFALGVRRNGQLLPVALVGLVSITGAMLMFGLNLIHPDLVMALASLLGSFLAGTVLYTYRATVPLSPTLAAGAAVVGWIIFAAAPLSLWWSILPIAYVTVFLGTRNPRRTALISGADYSYGIYLYGFVVQQSVMAVLPQAREWYWNLLISVPITYAIAALSWHLIEKPASRLRKPLERFEARWTARRARRATPTASLN